MDKTSTARKSLQNLSNPLEVRELNRQLEWVWRKILGGLTVRDFSEAGVTSVVTKVEKEIAEVINAEEITTNVLKSALNDMMVALIGVAKIDYAQIVDAFANRIFVDDAVGGTFSADKLRVTSAQIVDLVVNAFRIVADDGKVYKVSIGQDGNLATEYVSDEDSQFADGALPEGYSVVTSTIDVGDISAGKLCVKGAADVMKLTAKYLSADQGFINDLVSTTIFASYLMANQAFVNALYTGKIYGGKSIEIMVEDTAAAATAASEAQGTAENADSRAVDAYDRAVDAQKGVSTLNDYVEITDNGLNVKSAVSSGNYVNVNNNGVNIYVGNTNTSSFISKGLVLGNYILWQPEEAGGLAFNLLKGGDA